MRNERMPAEGVKR
jgi:hypothetical protein